MQRHRLRRGALPLPARRSRQNANLFLPDPLTFGKRRRPFLGCALPALAIFLELEQNAIPTFLHYGHGLGIGRRIVFIAQEHFTAPATKHNTVGKHVARAWTLGRFRSLVLPAQLYQRIRDNLSKNSAAFASRRIPPGLQLPANLRFGAGPIAEPPD